MRLLQLFALALLAPALALPAAAQGKVKTETITPPQEAPAPADNAARNAAAAPEVIRDFTRLPEAVRAKRERILDAAKTGELDKLAAAMRAERTMPVFSFGGETDPLDYWRTNHPDSDGIEVLGILVNILEMPFVHMDRGTPQEMFVWPYFYGMALDKLTPEQKVELFRLVTGVDYRDMREFGGYIFYRVGISPDGAWHFFVAGD